jgi:hypothetical protein
MSDTLDNKLGGNSNFSRRGFMQLASGLLLPIIINPFDKILYAQDNKPVAKNEQPSPQPKPYKNTITFEEACKSKKPEVRRQHFEGLLYEEGALYHKEHCPQGHIGTWFDFNDKRDDSVKDPAKTRPHTRKALELRIKEEARFEGQIPEEKWKEFVSNFHYFGHYCRGPPKQRAEGDIPLPFVIAELGTTDTTDFTYYSAEKMKEFEKYLRRDIRTAKHIATIYDTGKVFGKEIPRMTLVRLDAERLEIRCRQLADVLELKLPDKAAQESVCYDFRSCVEMRDYFKNDKAYLKTKEGKAAYEFFEHVLSAGQEYLKSIGYKIGEGKLVKTE